MTVNSSGNCVTTTTDTDLCPNIDGNQSTIPQGMTLNSSGTCIRQSCTDLANCPPPILGHICSPTQTLVNGICITKTCQQLGTCLSSDHPPIPLTGKTPPHTTPPSHLSSTGSVLGTTLSHIRQIFQTPQGDIFSKTIAAVGIIIGALGTLGVLLFATPFSASELVLIPVRVWSWLLSALGLRKLKTHWGTVYDFATKQPLDPVYIRLLDREGKEVATALTDLDGRYGFLVPPGFYKMIPGRTNYTFPSILAGHLTRDEIYPDLYFGNYFEVKKSSDPIKYNIPMDPENFDWNEFAKKDQNLMKFHMKKDILFFRISQWFFTIGFVLALFSIIFGPHPYNFIIFALYILLSILKEVGINFSKLGEVVDKKTKAPLSYALIRVFSYNLGNEVIHKVTTDKGFFYCLVPNSSYYITIEKKNKDSTYTQVFKSGKLEVKKGMISGRWEV